MNQRPKLQRSSQVYRHLALCEPFDSLFAFDDYDARPELCSVRPNLLLQSHIAAPSSTETR
ncbi:hypothetical protein PoB_005196900 [Plakobranchus ocellatus]|uniref:Uncharacterized protein n=1 Tax=Plakobranchus ocellatus TaxID=259542 RepID=A0AAV4C2W6_9GAST|nr:hypothetical protein PoB_005196900 [Plakobranchus ocellatus]